MKNLFTLLTAVALVSAATFAEAATFTISTNVSQAMDLAFNPIANPPGVPGNNVMGTGGPAVYQVDFLLTVNSLAAGEDSFGLVGFNINLGAGLSDAADAGWTANNPNVDTNGAAPGGTAPLFSSNGDFGTAGDELGLLVQMATGAFTNAADPRRTVGEAGSSLGVPFLLGSLFVQWNGTTTADLTITGAQFASKLTDGTFAGNQQGTTTGTHFEFGVPEPSSLALAGLSLVGLVLRRRNG